MQYEREDQGWLGIGSNGVVGRVGQINVRPVILIQSIEPKIILTRSSIINQHTITVEASNLHIDGECYFILNSTDRASLHHTFEQSSIVKGTLVDATHLACQLPPDYTTIGDAVLNVHIGFETNLNTMSLSSISLHITD